MGEELEPTQRVADERTAGRAPAGPPSPRPADPVRDITVPAADPFASTLTVAVGPAPAGPRLEVGRELGPVRLVREIGRGATGTVYQGHHTVLGRDVAVKFLVNVTAGPGDAEGLRRFVDEARAAASVRHPNLTQVFHADLDGATPYLVLEYVQGPTLRQLLDHAGDLTVPLAAAVLSDVASAVAELHSRGIIHRDIKPSNVLVDKEGRVFVTDFGLALRRSHTPGHGSAAAEMEFAGTPAYMAGEMFEGRVSSRSDVYAMGVVAFQLLTGSTPFSGAFDELREKHLREPLPVEALRCRGVKPEVVEVIERATNKQAMFRYKTAPDFARALREAAACGVPELARARKRLCDLVLARTAGVPSAAGGAGGGGATAEIRLPFRAGDADDDSGSSLYTETISRIATLKRERRRHPSAEGDGSTTRVPGSADVGASPPARHDVSTIAASAAVPFAGASAGGALAPTPPPVAPAQAVGLAADGVAAARPAVPGELLLVGVIAIVYGTLAAIWQAGAIFGATDTRAWLPPVSQATARIYLFLVPAAIAHAAVVALFVPAAIGCLRLKRWGRRVLAVVAAADLALQCAVLLAALAWVGPVTAGYLASAAGDAAGERAAQGAAVTRHWLAQWFKLSLFPGIVLTVTTRRRTRAAFDAAALAASAAPEGEGEEPEPYF